MSDITFNFLGMSVNCEYDKDDGELIACDNQGCDFFEQMLSEYYLERLSEEMHKAIKAKSDDDERERQISNYEDAA